MGKTLGGGVRGLNLHALGAPEPRGVSCAEIFFAEFFPPYKKRIGLRDGGPRALRFFLDARLCGRQRRGFALRIAAKLGCAPDRKCAPPAGAQAQTKQFASSCSRQLVEPDCRPPRSAGGAVNGTQTASR
jgi:hypothetical protein